MRQVGSVQLWQSMMRQIEGCFAVMGDARPAFQLTVTRGAPIITDQLSLPEDAAARGTMTYTV